MSAESNMRQRVIQALHGMDPISVENFAHPGTPDINCTGGWIELKCCDGWPAHASTPLRLPHFTPQQRVWLTRRWRANRRAWLLLRVGKGHDATWLLFGGERAAEVIGTANKSELTYAAIAIWSPHLVDAELRSFVHP